MSITRFRTTATSRFKSYSHVSGSNRAANSSGLYTSNPCSVLTAQYPAGIAAHMPCCSS